MKPKTEEIAKLPRGQEITKLSRRQEIAKLPINICHTDELTPTVIAIKHSSKAPAVTEKERFSQAELSENLCYIHILPAEVLDIILKLSNNNKSVRRVCKHWYSFCKDNVSLYFDYKYNLESESRYLENCGFDRVKIRFSKCTMSKLSTNAWRKFGKKIHSLDLEHCHLGDTVMENMVTHCDNLQVLRITRLYCEPFITICSTQALERLNIEQKRLNTFFLGNFGPAGSTFEYWERFYSALFRIYPNIVNFETYFSLLIGKYPTFEFVTKFCDSKAGVVPPLALWHSSVANQEWEMAFTALSCIRLTTRLTLHTNSVQPNDLPYLINFFKHQKSLKSVDVQGSSRIPTSVGAPLFMQILNIPELRKFRIYNAERPLDEHNENLPSIFSKISKLETFLVTPIKCAPRYAIIEYLARERERFYLKFIPKFTHLDHLSLEGTTDAILQSVYQHMTNLKTLRICVDSHGQTNIGLVGSDEGIWRRRGIKYSIKRLKNLEELCIYTNTTCYPGQVDDAIYDEFQFPKLRYLCCFSPKEPSKFAKAASNMPSLTKLHLSFKDVSLSYLEQLGQYIPKLETLYFFRYEKDQLIGSEAIDESVRKIFSACPSLRCLGTRWERCELFPGEIRYTQSYKELGKCHDEYRIVRLHFNYLKKYSDAKDDW